jgi:biotin operon repressor
MEDKNQSNLERARLYFQSGGRAFYNPFTQRTELLPDVRRQSDTEIIKSASQKTTFQTTGQTTASVSLPKQEITVTPQDLEKLEQFFGSNTRVTPSTPQNYPVRVNVDVSTPVHASNTTHITQQKKEDNLEQNIQQRIQQVQRQMENLKQKSEELSQRYLSAKTEEERRQILKRIEELNKTQEELVAQYYGLKLAKEKIEEVESDPAKNVFAHIYTALSGKGGEYFMSLFFGDPRKVVREKIIEETTRRVKEQDLEPSLMGLLKSVGRTEYEFFLQNPIGLGVTSYAGGYGLTALAKVPQVAEFGSKVANVASKIPGAVNVGKFVTEHPYLTFGAIETAKIGYQTYSYLSTPKEQIIFNKEEFFENFQQEVEGLKEVLGRQGYLIKEEAGKIWGEKDVLVHTEDLAKLYAEQREAIKQSVQDYLSKGYSLVEQTPERIVLMGPTNVVTIKTKEAFEDLEKAIEEYKKELERQGYKVEEKKGKLYVYGKEKVVYDVEGKRKEIEEKIDKLVKEYKSKGYSVREEGSKIIFEKPFEYEEIVQKIGADVLKDVSVFVGFVKGIEKGIRDFFTIKEEGFILAKASKDVSGEELYKTIKNVNKPEKLQKMFGPKEKSDHTLLVELKEEGAIGLFGARLYQKGYGRGAEIAESLRKGEEGILKREAIIQFERPFGYQTALSKEEFSPQILKEGKVIWQEGPYKIIEYKDAKYFVSDIPPKNVVEVTDDFVKSIVLGKTERTFYKSDYFIKVEKDQGKTSELSEKFARVISLLKTEETPYKAGYLVQKGEDWGRISFVRELPAKEKEIYIPIKEKEESAIKGFRGKPTSNVLRDLAKYYEKLNEKEKLEKAKEVARETKAKPSKIAVTSDNIHVGMPETKIGVKPIFGLKEEVEYMINKELFEKLREGFAGVRVVNVVSPKLKTMPIVTQPKLLQTTKTDVTTILDKDLTPKDFKEFIKPRFDITAIRPKLDVAQKQIVVPRKFEDIIPQMTQTRITTYLTTEKTLAPIGREFEWLKRIRTGFSLPLRFKLPELPKGSVEKFRFFEFRTSKQPTAYEASLVGVAFGIKAKDISKMFTGFEIRGVPIKTRAR